MSKTNILVVDDDSSLLDLIRMRLEDHGFHVAAAANEDQAKETAVRQLLDVAVIDLQLINQDGISLMEELHLIHPDMPVIILTAHGSIESAVEAMKRGAFTYLTKPFDSRELILQIERALEKTKLTGEIKRLRELLGEKYNFTNIVAKSEAMRNILDQVARIAGTDSTVAIYGPSGTGKELIAKAIHIASPRKDYPFLAINCAAIPESLLESELFGYEKGAFTGAERRTRGLFTRADKGTLLLDEIGDMPFSIQAKLLRVLQERIFFPLGSDQPVSVDVRVIAATNKDLKDEVRAGRFREDLFYRIHVIPIELPALKNRKEDIPSLVEHFIKKYGDRLGKEIQSVTPAAMRKLMLYDWPGNVRELENIIEYAVVMTDTDILTDDLILQNDAGGDSFLNFQEARTRFEKNYLLNLLKATGGNVSKAAELAGKYRADLYNLLKKHNISPADFKN
ncbi:MAG: sigma-54 dependent transcriptional regulator [Desulfobulbaceae bacterium]|jgi:two-component system response regulator GlrR|nr:sigma-54 dependent transcriptional regulator [Desulfobulbaceae bacterium]MDY0351347.1 sigma-54 dependent transcriptional regulator [Desulfobulbaceae bacterium]